MDEIGAWHEIELKKISVAEDDVRRQAKATSTQIKHWGEVQRQCAAGQVSLARKIVEQGQAANNIPARMMAAEFGKRTLACLRSQISGASARLGLLEKAKAELGAKFQIIQARKEKTGALLDEVKTEQLSMREEDASENQVEMWIHRSMEEVQSEKPSAAMEAPFLNYLAANGSGDTSAFCQERTRGQTTSSSQMQGEGPQKSWAGEKFRRELENRESRKPVSGVEDVTTWKDGLASGVSFTYRKSTGEEMQVSVTQHAGNSISVGLGDKEERGGLRLNKEKLKEALVEGGFSVRKIDISGSEKKVY